MKKIVISIAAILILLSNCEQVEDITDITPPGEISAVQIEYESNEITLTWTNPTDSDFQYVEIWYGENEASVLFEGALDPLGTVFSNLINGKTYYFLLKSFDSSGNVSESSLISFYLPDFFQIHYDGNKHTSGSEPIDNKDYDYNSEAIIAGADTLIRTGYTFIGWNTKEDGSGDKYLIDDKINVLKSDITLYAQWTMEQTYTISYYGNENTSGTPPNDKNVYLGTAETSILDSGTLGKVGYVFLEWNTKSDGSGTTYTVNEVISLNSNNLILYAIWKFELNPIWGSLALGSYSGFKSITSDNQGFIYCVGNQGDGSYDYGNGVNLYSSQSALSTPCIVKYDSSGNAIWGHSPSSDIHANYYFEDVTVDESQNIYCIVNSISGVSDLTFSLNVDISDSQSFIVKYSSSGIPIFAKKIIQDSSHRGNVESHAIASDSNGNIYVSGQYSTWTGGSLDFGDGHSLEFSGGLKMPFLAKYDSTGNTLWAVSVSGEIESRFESISIDTLGNVYVSGGQKGTGAYSYGNGVELSAINGSTLNSIIVKYDTNGNALWGKTIKNSYDGSFFNSIKCTQDDYLIVSGYQYGREAFYYDSTTSIQAGNSNSNPVLLKYSSQGEIQWGRTVHSDTYLSYFSVDTDNLGNIYCAGDVYGDSLKDFGNEVTLLPEQNRHDSSVLLVMYDSNGNAITARAISNQSDSSIFMDIFVNGYRDIYAIGSQVGYSSYNYGNDVVLTGNSDSRSAIVMKYN